MTTPRQIGKYQVLGEIASGAQGAVYRAVDPATAMTVAVKVLTGQGVTDVERLRREASLVQAIDHENVVRLIEVGESEGLHFMAMEFIPETLSNLIEITGALPVERAVALATGISDGLGYAHAQGIVHHDIKPQNVLLTPDGIPKVTDFGIARGEMLNTMTATGAMMGTPYYMSPEQANGERGDPRSDVYSLGCLLYQLLSGALPFSGGSPLSILRRHVEELPEPLKTRLPGIPDAVARCVEQAMAKDPGQRYADGNAFSTALREALPSAVPDQPREAGEKEKASDSGAAQAAGSGMDGDPPVSSTAAGPPAGRKSPGTKTALAVVAGVLLVVALPFFVYQLFESGDPAIAFVSDRDGTDDSPETITPAAAPAVKATTAVSPTPVPAPTAAPLTAPPPPGPVSSDGRIAFSSARDGNHEIYVMDADGSDQTRLTSNPADDGMPSWGPAR